MLENRAHLFHHHGTYVALRLLATCLPWKGSNVMKGMMQDHQRAADSMPMPGDAHAKPHSGDRRRSEAGELEAEALEDEELKSLHLPHMRKAQPR